ncbi:MAG: radical SAM protein [Deltaproteobacteria bacterium]|nr:MAG: radical SAM protein [Deltaproteobacteria bacterium]
MARVLVVHPPVSLAPDFIDYPYFADLGAVQLAAVLRDAGHAVTLVDAYALPTSGLVPRDDGRLLLGAPGADVIEHCQRALRASGGAAPDLVVCAYTPFHRPPHRDPVLAEVLTGLQELGAPVLLADCYQSGQHYIEADGDVVLAAYPEVIGWLKYEAEQTLLELLEDGSYAGVHRGQAPVLDDLPFPAWDLVDLEAHDAFRGRVTQRLGRGAWSFPIDGRTLPLVTSRGCPFKCVHCSSNPDRRDGEPKTQRRYSAARLGEYIRTLAKDHGATRLAALDELINVKPSHFDTFIEHSLEHSLAFDVPNGMRADYLSPRHFARMRGHVTTVSVSAESGAQRVVSEVVNKQLDLGEIERVAEAAHRAAVPLMIHWIIGMPGESAEEINETLERALDLWDRFHAFPAVQFATPLPGTGLARGRALPVVDDWGPHFQKSPAQPGAAVDGATLERFKATFDERLSASTGPQKLIVNVTYACNNHCPFCAVGTRTMVDGHPTRQREHLAKYRRHGVRMVDFDGGEPTLNPELIPLIRYARKLGYDRINVTTNGRLTVYEEYAEKLVRSGLTTLLFSVHGPDAKTHAQQTGVAEAFEQTIGGIENCLRLAPEGVDLGMNITITKGNHELLPEVTQLAWDLGLRWLNIQFLTPFGRATKWVAPDTHHAAEIAMGVIDEWRGRMKLEVINLPFCFMPGYEAHMAGDLNKLSRHMIFVNNETVNLADYLGERRTHRPECAPCPHRCFCGGFYDLESSPEPPWLVSADSLVRPVSPDLDVR